MPKFTFLAWNVRMYRGDEERLEQADKLITELNPDVFGLIEFKDAAKKKARELMFSHFQEYDFSVTDSTGQLELLVGTKRGVFQQVIWTQRREFNNLTRTHRPGGLISLNYGGDWYNLLFLHAKAGSNRTSYENRAAVFPKIWSLDRALKKVSPDQESNLIVLGDLNTMGNGRSISGREELERLRRAAGGNDMKLLEKDFAETYHQWSKRLRRGRRPLRISELPGALRSDLDHVIASESLQFQPRGEDGSPIHVKGWRQLDGQDRIDFLWELSDHSAIFGQVA